MRHLDLDTFNALSPALQSLVAQQVNDAANDARPRKRRRRGGLTLAEARRRRAMEFWEDTMGELAILNVFGGPIR